MRQKSLKDSTEERDRKIASGELVKRRRRNGGGGDIYLSPEEAAKYDKVYGENKLVSDDNWTGW